MKNIKGFTLIELMVVIAIIAILATVGTQKYREYQSGTANEEATEQLACEDGNRVLRTSHGTRQVYDNAGKPQRCADDEK